MKPTKAPKETYRVIDDELVRTVSGIPPALSEAMTRRDWFAAAALNAMIGVSAHTFDGKISRAWEYADAMLVARETK